MPRQVFFFEKLDKRFPLGKLQTWILEGDRLSQSTTRQAISALRRGLAWMEEHYGSFRARGALAAYLESPDCPISTRQGFRSAWRLLGEYLVEHGFESIEILPHYASSGTIRSRREVTDEEVLALGRVWLWLTAERNRLAGGLAVGQNNLGYLAALRFDKRTSTDNWRLVQDELAIAGVMWAEYLAPAALTPALDLLFQTSKEGGYVFPSPGGEVRNTPCPIEVLKKLLKRRIEQKFDTTKDRLTIRAARCRAMLAAEPEHMNASIWRAWLAAFERGEDPDVAIRPPSELAAKPRLNIPGLSAAMAEE